MKLELGKSYKTLSGYKATVLDVNFRKYADNHLEPCAVVKVWINDHEEVYSYNLDGSLHGPTHLTSLGITSEWDDLEEIRNLPMDAKIFVRDREGGDWKRRYFSHVDVDGKIYTWTCGVTSWSAQNASDLTAWSQAKLPEDV